MRGWAQVEGVLFDMDGTLVESHAAVERAWRTWAREYGVDPGNTIAVAHGSPAEHTVAAMRPDLDAARIAEAAARQLQLQYEDLHDVRPAGGALALIEAVTTAGLPWAVVTSADARLAAARLGRVGIAPPVVVTVDDVERGKPDPEGYLMAARLIGVAIERCLVVEDSDVGVAAGRAAGAFVVGVRGVAADLSVSHLGELSEHLRGA
jgi:sugar-phosphatase